MQESSESTITACPCFYILRASAVAHIYEFAGMQQMTQHRRSSMGHLMEYLINPVAGSPESRRHGFFVMRLPSGYRLIGGSIDLSQYQLLDERFRDWERDKLTAQPSHELGTVGRNGGTAGREFIEVGSPMVFAVLVTTDRTLDLSVMVPFLDLRCVCSVGHQG